MSFYNTFIEDLVKFGGERVKLIEVCVLILIITTLINSVLVYINLSKCLPRNKLIPYDVETFEESKDENYTPSERDREFDERNEKLKEEIARQQPIIERMGVPALEMHPDVKNLPHTIIIDKSSHDLEIAD